MLINRKIYTVFIFSCRKDDKSILCRNTPFSHLLKTFLFTANFYVCKVLATLFVMFALSLHYKGSDNICNHKYIGCFSLHFKLCCIFKIFINIRLQIKIEFLQL